MSAGEHCARYSSPASRLEAAVARSAPSGAMSQWYAQAGVAVTASWDPGMATAVRLVSSAREGCLWGLYPAAAGAGGGFCDVLTAVCGADTRAALASNC